MENLFTATGLIKRYNKPGVYLLQIGNKLYVGSSSCSLGSRLSTHRFRLRKNTHENVIMINSFNKYGESCTHFKVLEICTPEETITREQFYIDTLKPELNIELNPILQNSDYNSKKVYQYSLTGAYLKEHTSAAAAERSLKKANSKISQTCMGKRKSAYGFQWSYIKVEKMNYTNSSSKAKCRKLGMYTNNTLVKVFDSAADAIRYLAPETGTFGGNCAKISACCIGRIKKAFDHTWKYL